MSLHNSEPPKQIKIACDIPGAHFLRVRPGKSEAASLPPVLERPTEPPSFAPPPAAFLIPFPGSVLLFGSAVLGFRVFDLETLLLGSGLEGLKLSALVISPFTLSTCTGSYQIRNRRSPARCRENWQRVFRSRRLSRNSVGLGSAAAGARAGQSNVSQPI